MSAQRSGGSRATLAAGFRRKLAALHTSHQRLLARKNRVDANWNNGVFQRFVRPVLTAEHIPLDWRYDLDPEANPRLLERMAVNAVFNAGAMVRDGRILVCCRVEGTDRKSFFAIAESRSGVDGFRFWPTPLPLPDGNPPDTNVYDMRLVAHEDGWIYGLFCTERKDPSAPPHDTSSAIAQCGLVRTKDLVRWERLPDLATPSPQQRNVVLHPEFIDGQYGFYTRPQDGFIGTGSGGGIGWATCSSMEHACITSETIVDARIYHTIKEVKNGQGPVPLRTPAGWLHLAHGVRNTAAGLRYVLYLFMTSLQEPWRVTHAPGGYFLAPWGEERVGDVSNVVFSNGWVVRENGEVLIYYASSDTRLHVSASSVEKLVDYCLHTPPDPLTSRGAFEQRMKLIEHNHKFMR